jgi:hypothetical protein
MKMLKALVEKVVGMFSDQRSSDERKRRVSTYTVSVTNQEGKEDKCFVYDLSASGVGLLTKEGSTLSVGERISITFPINANQGTVVRTGQVKTVKIYQPKPSTRPFHMLRCSIAFDRPLEKNDYDSVAVESFANE